MANERTPQQIIGDDAFNQLTFEGYVVTRPSAPVEGLVTERWDYLDGSTWKMCKDLPGQYLDKGFRVRELVPRSQAEAIIAAKDAKIAGAEEAHKTLIDVKNSIIEGLAKNLFVFAQDTGSRMVALEADNAAQAARIKELSALIDGENCADPDKIDALFRRAETAETQLAAAKKALTDIQCIDWDGLSVSDVFDEINEIVERAALEDRP